MKRLLFLLACACSTPPRSVEIPAPLASATVAPAHDDEVVLPRGAKPVAFGAEAPWAAGFPKAKTFAVYDAANANRVLLTWRIGKYRVANAVESPEDDYPGNHVAPIELGVRARNQTHSVAFGELGGSVRPAALAWCAPSDHETTHSAFAAAFSIGTMQGDDEMVIVRDGPTLHVLHRETSDGSCEEAKQGPLDVCEGFAWELAADLHVSRGAAVYEMVEAEGKPFDCAE